MSKTSANNEETETNTKNSCPACKKAVKRADKALECEICNNWVHIKCENLNEAEYAFLGEHKSLHWYCNGCNTHFAKLLSVVANMKMGQEELGKRVSEIEHQVKLTELGVNEVKTEIVQINDKIENLDVTNQMKTTIDTRIAKVVSKFNSEIDALKQQNTALEVKLETAIEAKLAGCLETVETIKANTSWATVAADMETKVKQVDTEVTSFKKILEDAKAVSEAEKDRESRILNAVIYKVEETGITREERTRADKTFVMELLNDVLNLNTDDSEILSVFRLGKRGDSSSRPLLVKFRDRTTKNKFMESLYKLKSAADKFRQISVAHDFTKKEREDCKVLVQQAKEMQNNESGEFLWRVRGPPGNLKVVKLKKAQA